MATIDEIKNKYGVQQNDATISMTANEAAAKLKQYFDNSVKFKSDPKSQKYWNDKLRDTIAAVKYDASRMAKLAIEYQKKMDSAGL